MEPEVRSVIHSLPSEGKFLAVLLATKTVDSATTIYGLTSMENVHEMNPFARAAFDALGVVGGTLLIQLLIIGVFVGLAKGLQRASPDEIVSSFSPPTVYASASLVFGYVALSNISIILFRTPFASFLTRVFEVATGLS